MRILVIGAERRSCVTAVELLREPAIQEVSIVEGPGRAEVCSRLSDSRLSWVAESSLGERGLDALMARHAVVVSPVRSDTGLARRALAAGCHFVGGARSESSLRELMGLDAEARRLGRVLLPAMGLAPGLVNVIASDLVERLGRCDSLQMSVGGLPVRPVGALGLTGTVPVRELLEDSFGEVEILRDGELARVPALSDCRPVSLPAPFGQAESARTAAGLSLMAEHCRGRVDSLEFRTIRHPGHFERVRFLAELGLLGDQEWDFPSGQRISPREVVVEAIERAQSYPEMGDLVVLEVVAEARQDGESRRIVVRCLDFGEPARGVAAAERMAAYPIAVVARRLARGEAIAAGARPPERSLPWSDLRPDLEASGIVFTEEETRLGQGSPQAPRK